MQKKNGDKEHLKYAEHVQGPDGSKQYTEYWSDNLVDANLKHDHEMTFAHPHTVVYKVMLRGFIFDIPGGSQLRMSGDAWGGKETILTLGSKDDKEPFVKVGEYGKENYEDNVLTAYIIRQVAGNVDGVIKTGEKLKFELLTYDELDGTVMPLDPNDTMRNGNPAYGPDYFTNLPWGEEYTWDVFPRLHPRFLHNWCGSAAPWRNANLILTYPLPVIGYIRGFCWLAVSLFVLPVVFLAYIKN